jgi:hypothetical protein
MPRNQVRSINVVDVMILVAATGFSLSCYVLLDNAAFGGRRYIYNLFESRPGGWNFLMVMIRAADAAAMPLPLLGGWTLVLPILRLRNSRGNWRSLGRQPGVMACLAAMAGMAFCSLVGALAFSLSWWIDGQPQSPARGWGWMMLFHRLVIDAGLAVGAVWLTQAATGRWRRSADWIDRLGRFVGAFWLAAGLIFAILSLY